MKSMICFKLYEDKKFFPTKKVIKEMGHNLDKLRKDIVKNYDKISENVLENLNLYKNEFIDKQKGEK